MDGHISLKCKLSEGRDVIELSLCQFSLNTISLDNVRTCYKFLTCTAMFYDNKMWMLSLPLRYSNNKFEIYKAYNFPVPMQTNQSGIAKGCTV